MALSFCLPESDGRRNTCSRQPHRDGNRLALALSLALLAYRLSHRLLSRLRTGTPPFRARHPRVAAALTGRHTAAVGAATVAGGVLSLALPPPPHGYGAAARPVIAIYLASRTLEAVFDALEADGWFAVDGRAEGKDAEAAATRRRWWIVGSWLLVPMSLAQLVRAFFFSRDTVPTVWLVLYRGAWG